MPPDANEMLYYIMSTQSAPSHTEFMDHAILTIAADFPDTKARYDDGNIYITKGHAEWYPCVVAHTDTVHEIIPQHHYSIHRSGDILFAYDNHRHETVGIGGDDKVGIYIALMQLHRLPAVKLAFFRDEEIGCIGSSKADMSFFDDVSMVLQCDRNGYGEFVTDIGGTPLHSDTFLDAARPFMQEWSMKPVNGMLTDVVTLKENGLQVSAANIACGYYYAHTDREIISITEMTYAMDFVTTLCNQLGHKPWYHEAPIDHYRYGYHGYRNLALTTGQNVPGISITEDDHICASCQAPNAYIYVLSSEGYLCDECYDDYRYVNELHNYAYAHYREIHEGL